ncbi:hypothetical protein C7B67_04255 [filamentous cyanobacterium Phorm 6]|nr:hypothetical protein C7B67_04255 [filamentous cyanobacterium Phorm 6]
MFLRKLLSLLPPSMVRFIGNSSFANLAERQTIETWIVIEKSEEIDLQPDCYYYCGLQLKIVHASESWEWFVYDGRGIDLIKSGSNPTEEGSLAEAKKWIDDFFRDEV